MCTSIASHQEAMILVRPGIGDLNLITCSGGNITIFAIVKTSFSIALESVTALELAEC